MIDSSEQVGIMKQMRIFAGITDEKLRKLSPMIDIQIVKMQRGDVIFGADERISEILYLKSGHAQGVRQHKSGAVDLVQLFSPGETIALDIVCSTTKECPFQISAASDITGFRVNFDSLLAAPVPAEISQVIMNNCLNMLANESIRRLHKIDVLYRKHIRSRISAYLRQMARMNGQRRFRIHMDREQMSQYLGVNRSALSHELAEMQRDGLISFHKETFEILSPTIIE